MCVSITSIQGCVGEAECKKQLLLKALAYEKQYEIIPSSPDIEGAPYDLSFSIREKDGTRHDKYRVQVKTTFKIDGGEISFGTSRKSGKRYSEEEIDFLFLYYYNAETKEEWRGLALPSECTTKTHIAYNPLLSSAKRQATDFDFDFRFTELIETGTIEPVCISQDDTEYPDIPEEENELAALDLNDDDVFFSLLSKYGYILDDIANALKMDKKIFMQYHAAYINRKSSCSTAI